MVYLKNTRTGGETRVFRGWTIRDSYLFMAKALQDAMNETIISLKHRHHIGGNIMGPLVKALLGLLVQELLKPENLKKIEMAVLEYAEAIAAGTATKLDDAFVQAIAKALGIDLPPVPAKE